MNDSQNKTTGTGLRRDSRRAGKQEDRVEARLRLCEEYLDAGTLGRRQMGVLYGCMGGGYFGIGYDRMRAAYASGKPSPADVSPVRRRFSPQRAVVHDRDRDESGQLRRLLESRFQLRAASASSTAR